MTPPTEVLPSPPLDVERPEVIARRRFLQRAAVLAWSTPLIMVVTSTPALACGAINQTCPSSGCCNVTTGQCCSASASNITLRGKCGIKSAQRCDTSVGGMVTLATVCCSGTCPSGSNKNCPAGTN